VHLALRQTRLLAAAGWLAVAALTGMAEAQVIPPTPPTAATVPSQNLLRVFLDCNDCDIEYVRQNVEFVDYVRDRAVADLHVMVTTQQTGGGGSAWTVKFIGLGPRQGQDRTLTFDTLQTATPDDRRKAFVRILKIGVVGYAADTTAGPQLDVTWTKPAQTGQTTATRDKWNFWVFRIETSGNINGERSTNQQSYRLNFSGNRTTDRWKINLSTNGSYSTNRFIVDEGQTIKSLSHSWDVNALVVKSLTPRWSFGARGSVNHSSFSNNDLSFTGAPGFEYDFFPYSESSRRSLTLQYTIGVSRFKYREVTVFDKLRETVPNHQILAMLALKQPWGSVQVQYAVAEHLNHADRYRASLFSQAEVRLFKGFSFNLFGAYNKINDQISLRKDPVSTDDVLLHVQQLATSYSYFIEFGISYSFGSIFNNVVNTRFGQ
jgi:Protein of unknown function, DUF481